jgi:tetratricopeptide (TPR) repeat protein
LTGGIPTETDLRSVLQAIRTSISPDSWRESLRAHGPKVFNDLNLLVGLRNTAASWSVSDPQGADAIKRWLDALQQEQRPDNLERMLLSAGSDDEIHQILEAHRPLINPQLGMNALWEVRAMYSAGSPIPRSLLGIATEPILHRVALIADFLEDDHLGAECHFVRSRVLIELGELDAAVAELTAAARLFETLLDGFRQSQCLGQIGTLHLKLNRLDLAEQSLTASVRLLNPVPENDGLLAPTYEELAQIAARNGQVQTAAKYFSLAGDARLRQERVNEAAVNFRASVPLLLLDDESLAFANAEKFLDLSRTDNAEAAPGEVNELFMEGIARHLSGLAAEALAARDPLTGQQNRDGGGDQLTAAIRWVALAKRGLHLTGPGETRARIQFAAAALELYQPDPQAAAEDAAAALPYFEKADDFDSYVGLVQTFARAEEMRGRAEPALAIVEKALANLGQHDEVPALLTLQCQKLSALVSLGRIKEAIETQAEALALARRGDDEIYKYFQGSLIKALGDIYERVGRVEDAVPLDIEALRMARSLASRSAEARQLASLGILCGKLAERSFEDLPSRLRWELLSTIADQALGVALEAWKPGTSDDELRDQAIEVGSELFERSAQAHRDDGDLLAAAIVRGNLSNFTSGDEERLGELTDALAIVRTTGGTLKSEAVILANMGKSYMRLHRILDAQECFSYSLSLSDTSGDCEWAYDTAQELATTYLLQGMWGDAVKSLRLAVDYTEIGRGSLPLDDRTRISFARGKSPAYARLAALYLDRDRVADAFDVIQRAKSRALVDLGLTGTVRPTVPVTPDVAALLKREEILLGQLRQSVHGSAPTVPLPTRRSLPEIQAQLEDIYASLQPIDPRYVGMRSGQPVHFRELRQTLADQGRPILLVDYFLQPDELLIFLLRAEWDVPKCIKRVIEPGQIAGWREDFERQVVLYRGQGPQTWTSVTELLLEPIDEYRQEGDLIYLVPHDQLHGLPIHALPLGGAPLVGSHPVVYLPSASLLPLCQFATGRSGRLTTACAIGVEFENEARAVAALFPASEVLLGGLTAERIAEACSNCDVIHFSSHGYYDKFDPRRSGLVIKPQSGSGIPNAEAVLTAEELGKMRLASEVVCLSACQSGVGRLVHGDEQLGILRAIFLAGASSVISTLWPVDAQATHEFVMVFYEELLATFRATQRIDKSSAFHLAQERILQRHGEGGAYYWAPFVLSGDWT